MMSSQSSEPNTELLLQQATEWLVKMSSDDCTAQDRQAFLVWQQQSKQHQAAAQRIQRMIDRLQQLHNPHDQAAPRQMIEHALQEQPEFHIKPNIPHLILAGFSVMAAILAWYLLPVQYWMADHKASHNEWRNEKLSDHSDIKISGHSAYNLNFDQQQRIVELLNGNILVDVAKDAQRPFIVRTEHASIKALGTRFIIHQTEHYTILTMLESSVEVKTGSQVQTIHTGQQAIMDVTGTISVKSISPLIIERAWQKHSLAVEEMPLDQVLDILKSYQSGTLYYRKDQIKDLKVTAILPLDQQGKAYYLLQDSLPIQVTKPVPFVTRISKVE